MSSETPVTPIPTSVASPDSEVVELTALTAVIQSAVVPFAESQKVVAQETTKQTEILAREKTKMFWGLCLLALVILGLAAGALYIGKDQIAEKVLIAVISFLGGLGFGRQTLAGKG